jgi:hypothetical protein
VSTQPLPSRWTASTVGRAAAGVGALDGLHEGKPMKHRATAGLLAAGMAGTLLVLVAPASPAQPDVCADFQAQEDAQAALDRDPGLAQRQPLIDVDRDGIACEDLPRRGAPTPTRGRPTQTG